MDLTGIHSTGISHIIFNEETPPDRTGPPGMLSLKARLQAHVRTCAGRIKVPVPGQGAPAGSSPYRS